jgi:hypothetical protein
MQACGNSVKLSFRHNVSSVESSSRRGSNMRSSRRGTDSWVNERMFLSEGE